jgi:hypothetical protein
MCAGALFIESIAVLHEHEKYCIDVLRPRCAGMHYITRISYRIQKHKCDVTCPDALFLETAPIPPEHEK